MAFVRDFLPVATLVGTEYIRAVSAASPVNNFQEFLAQATVSKPAAETARIQSTPDFKQELALLGVAPFVNGPDQFAQFVHGDTAKYSKVIKAANVKITP